MKYSIVGDNIQFVVFEIEEGEEIYGEKGSMVYMSANMNMQTSSKGGMLKGLARKFSGDSMFQQSFSSNGGSAVVACSVGLPGKIYPMKLDGSKALIAQKSAFLVAESTVEMSTTKQSSIGGALFGGEGFFLQKFQGTGNVFVSAFGDFIELDLAEGQVYKVDTGCAVAWEDTVEYSIERVKGAKNMLLGGEGLFLTTMKGPGKVILQSGEWKDFVMSMVPILRPAINTN